MIYYRLRKILPLPAAVALSVAAYAILLALVFLCLTVPEARFLYGRL